MIDQKLMEMSDKLSCKHINILNKSYNENNISILKPTSSILTDDIDKEIYILRGIKVNNKSCNVKNENYSKGMWENQFEKNKIYNNEIFNIHSKNNNLRFCQ
tara:strand:+ start:78 stop:383 length:306 start_codon:yes stop_codon:yes gene_type:complete